MSLFLFLLSLHCFIHNPPPPLLFYFLTPLPAINIYIYAVAFLPLFAGATLPLGGAAGAAPPFLAGPLPPRASSESSFFAKAPTLAVVYVPDSKLCARANSAGPLGALGCSYWPEMALSKMTCLTEVFHIPNQLLLL